MIFVLIFDASEAFSFAVFKAPFFFSRIRSLTPLRLKKDVSKASRDAIAAQTHRGGSAPASCPSASTRRPRLTPSPRSPSPRRSPQRDEPADTRRLAPGGSRPGRPPRAVTAPLPPPSRQQPLSARGEQGGPTPRLTCVRGSSLGTLRRSEPYGTVTSCPSPRPEKVGERERKP